MSVGAFLDTNVLVYAVDTDPAAEPKRNAARALIREDRFGTSAQVVQEFYVAVTRKLANPLLPQIAARWVDRLTRMPFVPADAVLLKAAIIRAEAWGISYWDAAVVSAAEALGASTLFTEDLNDGQLYGNVRAVNPFANRPS
ncbi:PIN domain-containing protein [Bauldia sp.]|uniref:PIN domain-containing protein n=1 Tax=Bauldia sp. TaxID=2575872 RepID=UPI003BADA30E